MGGAAEVLVPGVHAIIIVAKEPTPGRVKTRLGATIGADAAADLAWAFLDDSLALAAAARADLEPPPALVVAHAPDAPGARFVELALRHGATLVPQGEGDLGARLVRALADGRGARVAIGADSPDLPPARIVDALRELSRPGGPPAVLGPAGDGGFHLVGLGPGVPSTPLGAGVRWSTPHAAADARRVLGPRTVDLAAWDDVDEVSDLAALELRLARSRAAPATRAWLAART